jgi:hypothetical protein
VGSPIHIALTQRVILFLTQNTDLPAHNSSGLAILVRSNTQVPPAISERERKSLCDKAMSPLLHTHTTFTEAYISVTNNNLFSPAKANISIRN